MNRNVYYEAGFAEGLKVPVIRICEKTAFEREGGVKSDFDQSHFNFILWEEGWLTPKVDSGFSLLAEKLRDRIINTVGKGPLA